MSSRNWVFTLNNFSPEQLVDFKNLVQDENNHVIYIVFQEEVGSTGTAHLQGYLVLQSPRELSYLRGSISPCAHWEKRHGTHAEARAYSIKEDTRVNGPWEYGTPPVGQGHRSDLVSISRSLRTGCSMKDIATEYPGQFVRYNVGLYKISDLLSSSEGTKRWIHVYHGPAGCGKTRLATTKYGSDYLMVGCGNSSNFWLNGYDGQKILILDDFFGWCRFSLLLRLLDRYPVSLETKGGHVSLRESTKHIILTSNSAPADWYKFDENEKLSLPALMRRFDEVRDFNVQPITTLEATLYFT